jgi:rhamnose utilization protein RhaD (predicted bifunctional aldolase and dehydrogenase)
VAVVQYTFAHKQYTEYRERNIHNNKKKKFWEVRAVPRLCELYPGICLTTEEKARKNLRIVEKCPDIAVAVVQYTFTHKQYTEYL